MSLNIHILKTSTKLSPYKNLIKQQVKKITKRADKLISLHDLDIIIAENLRPIIPEYGVGAETVTANIILVGLDPNHKDFNTTLKIYLGDLVAHELNHTLRFHSITSITSLLDALIFEGLADHFQIALTGNIPIWISTIKKEELKKYQILATKEYNNKDYSYYDWFLGTKPDTLPLWTGYRIGYILVDDYLKRTGKKIQDIIDVESEDFI